MSWEKPISALHPVSSKVSTESVARHFHTKETFNGDYHHELFFSYKDFGMK